LARFAPSSSRSTSPLTDSRPRAALMRVLIGPPSTMMPAIGGPPSLPGGKRFSSAEIKAMPIGVMPMTSSSSSETTIIRTPARRKRVSSKSMPAIPMPRMTFDGTTTKARTLDSTKNIGAPARALPAER
jgi:hypothetical protein